jgi:hypothetical protein
MQKIKRNQLLIYFCLIWVFFITVLRAIRWPNDFAEAQWLLTYEFGFLKRAFLGTFLTPFINPSNAEAVIKFVSSMFFLIFCAGLLWICVRIIKKSQIDINSVFIVLIFLTSPYIVMSAHLNGYFDNIIILCSILSCLLVIRRKIWIAALIMSVGMFIHESFLLVGFPSVIFFTLIKYTKELKTIRLTQLIIGFTRRFRLLIFLPLLAIVSIIIYQTFLINPDVIKNQLITYLSQFNFIQHNRGIIVPTEFTTSFFTFLINESPKFFSRITSPTYVVHIFIPLIILFIYAWNSLRVVAHNRLFFLILIIISILPLSLHLIAWDTSRIWTYPLVITILCIWGIKESFPTVDTMKGNSLLFCISAVLIIGFQLFISTPLMDGAHDRFNNELRTLFYMPGIIFIAMLVSKNYYLTKQRV